MVHYSGLQWRVLHLYRQFLHELKEKPVEMQSPIKLYIRGEFEKHRHISATDITTIEYFLRLGEKQLVTFRSKRLISFKWY
jgi:succinate dehydrogenase assembly factor 1